MQVFFGLGKALFGKLTFCAVIGAMIGIIAGSLFGLFQLGHPGLVLPLPEIIKIGLLLGLVGWLAVLVVVGAWRHYGVGTILLPALINAFFTALLTVYANNLVQLPVLAVVIGLLIGILVGSILCRLCEKPRIDGKGLKHG